MSAKTIHFNNGKGEIIKYTEQEARYLINIQPDALLSAVIELGGMGRWDIGEPMDNARSQIRTLILASKATMATAEWQAQYQDAKAKVMQGWRDFQTIQLAAFQALKEAGASTGGVHAIG